MAYAATGDRTKALENLESYSKRVPGDENVVNIIDAVRKGNIEHRNGTP